MILVMPGSLWTIIMFIMLVSKENENIFKDFFERNVLLRLFGEYSFSIYLWHPMCIALERYHKNIITNHMNRYVYIAFTSFLFSLVFYHFIERHFVRFSDYLSNLLKTKFESCQILSTFK